MNSIINLTVHWINSKNKMNREPTPLSSDVDDSHVSTKGKSKGKVEDDTKAIYLSDVESRYFSVPFF